MINPFSCALDTARYRIGDKGESFRIVHISDLHDEFYGENNKDLVCAIDSESPDIVVFTGDLTEPYTDHASMKQILSYCSGKYPTFCSMGNHETRGDIKEIKELVRASGATLLDGAVERVTVRGREVDVYGIDSYYTDLLCKEKDLLPWEDQITRCLTEKEKREKDKVFSLLLYHRPDFVKSFEKWGFDLVLSGHAHGGQFRIPKILNGLYAPNQGLFPRYAGGYYSLKGTKLIVSRGLCRRRFPRIYNRPEIVIIDVGR